MALLTSSGRATCTVRARRKRFLTLQSIFSIERLSAHPLPTTRAPDVPILVAHLWGGRTLPPWSPGRFCNRRLRRHSPAAELVFRVGPSWLGARDLRRGRRNCGRTDPADRPQPHILRFRWPARRIMAVLPTRGSAYGGRVQDDLTERCDIHVRMSVRNGSKADPLNLRNGGKADVPARAGTGWKADLLSYSLGS